MRRIICFCLSLSVLVHLGCSNNETETTGEETFDFTIMTYNIHYGNGTDGILDLNRIADVIKTADPDILVLTEVDRYYDPRSNYKDQLEILARQLNMNYQFQKTTWKSAIPESSNKPREFGHAVLSKYPVETMSTTIYEKYKTHYNGLLETKITIDNQIIYVYATHLATDQECLESQAQELLQKMSERNSLKILCGDFNATPDNSSIKKISAAYTDAFGNQNFAYTFRSDNPKTRIDYIFGSKEILFEQSKVIHSLASDHLPIISKAVLK